MKIDFKELLKLIEQVSTDYQKSGRIKNHTSKRLSTKGKENKTGAPYSQDPPTVRAKSAPPGFGFTMEELHKLIDQALLEQQPEEEEIQEPEAEERDGEQQQSAGEQDPPSPVEPEGGEGGASGILPDPAQDKVLAALIGFAKNLGYETAQVKGNPANAKDSKKATSLVVTNLGKRFDRDKIAKGFIEQFGQKINFDEQVMLKKMQKQSDDGSKFLNGVYMTGASGQPFKLHF